MIHEAHINAKEYTGFKQKSDISVPLCAIHHHHQHTIGELSFWGDDFEKAKACGLDIRKSNIIEDAFLAIARFRA